MAKYSTDFIKRVKEVFPTWKSLHEALDNGSYFVGRYLDDARYVSISINSVLEAKTIEDLHALQEEALKIKKINSLYSEWVSIWG